MDVRTDGRKHVRNDDHYRPGLWAGRVDQYLIFRWTTGYGEKYDYSSIMHYPSFAFSKNKSDPYMLTIVPKDINQPVNQLGSRTNLSAIDVIKIKKMYKCKPYQDW